MTNTAVERNRIAVFVAFALGIAVAVGGVLFATGGLRGSPEVGGVTLSSLLLPTAYMFSPAVANVATRLLTDEGWTNLRLQTNVSMEWGWYMIAWLGTSALIGVGFWLYTAVGEAGLVPAAPVGSGVGTATLIVSLTLGPAINTLVAVGEEFGWRVSSPETGTTWNSAGADRSRDRLGHLALAADCYGLQLRVRLSARSVVRTGHHDYRHHRNRNNIRRALDADQQCLAGRARPWHTQRCRKPQFSRFWRWPRWGGPGRADWGRSVGGGGWSSAGAGRRAANRLRAVSSVKG